MRPILQSTIRKVRSNMKSNKWASFAIGIWLRCTVGVIVTLAYVLPELQTELQLSPFGLMVIVNSSEIGTLSAILVTIAAEHLDLWHVTAIGSGLLPASYGLQWLLMRTKKASLWNLAPARAVGGIGIGWFNAACNRLATQNFSDPRQATLAATLSSSFTRISPVMYMIIAESFNDSPNAMTYFAVGAMISFMVGVVVSLVLWIGIPEVSSTTSAEESCSTPCSFDSAMFIQWYGIVVAMGMWLIVASHVHKIHPRVSLGAIILLLLACPLIMLCCGYRKSRKIGDAESGVNVNNGYTEGEMLSSSSSPSIDTNRSPSEDINLCAAVNVMSAKGECNVQEWKESLKKTVAVLGPTLKTGSFSLYLLGYMFATAVGNLFPYIFVLVAHSRGMSSTQSIGLIVSATGIFGALLAPLLNHTPTISETSWMAVLSLVMALSFLGLLGTTNEAFYKSAAFISACMGALTSMAASTTKKLFGEDSSTVLHSLVIASGSVGSFIFSFLAAYIYKRYEEQNGICSGSPCFRVTWILGVVLCLMGFLCFVAPSLKTRIFTEEENVESANTSGSDCQQQNPPGDEGSAVSPQNPTLHCLGSPREAPTDPLLFTVHCCCSLPLVEMTRMNPDSPSPDNTVH